MDIENEIKNAEKKYGHFNSTHEVYSVLQEEVDEFWDVVKTYAGKTSIPITYYTDELKQIAAIAQRAIKELESNQIKFT